MIIVHLNSSDYVHAFYGLNHRFNLIVTQSVHHFIISKDHSTIGFDKYKSHINNAIGKICFDVELLPQVFLPTYHYFNLHSIVLRCSELVTVHLNVNCDSIKNAIRSCLDIFCVCNIFSADSNNDNWFYNSHYCKELDTDAPTATILNGLTCSAIVRLSINSCSEQILFSLCTCAPNLIYLKIKQLISTDDNLNINTVSTLIPQSPLLKQLYITANAHRLDNIHLVGRLIGYYRSSLEHLALEISLDNQIDGYHLQTILEPCRYLQKFSFIFNHWHEETEKIDVLHQFQSDWWLDSHQPTVLIFYGNQCETMVVSMPCYLDDYTWFPIDPKDWLVNKGQLDSPDIHFKKQKCIRFTNSNRQLITLDLVRIIGHVFQAPKQELSIPHWGFVSPDLFIEHLLNTRSEDPMLPMIHSLDLNSCNLDLLDAKTLIIWLLLTPNVKVLNLCQGTPATKIQLANRLKLLLEEDKRLKSITDSIEEVQVFYMFDSLSFATKQHICQMYSNIFRKPIIRR
ncbi:unnamed protein product [Adineta steineri]|uniref:Uncharacterized protein n=1 Tax=Adineta steineri TaxID=433720 RepID=A0A814GBV5_9BILA|nr:unnamed protein product [Adineta steineri]CAF1267688.1 unnamed protein product [Adineta steineri]